MSAAVVAQPVLSMSNATFESCEAYNNSNYHAQVHHHAQATPYPKDPWTDRSANSGAVNFDDEEDEEELSPARHALAKAAAGCPVMCDFLRVLVIHRLRTHEGCGELDAKAHAERVVSGVRDDNRLMILYALMVFNEVKFY